MKRARQHRISAFAAGLDGDVPSVELRFIGHPSELLVRSRIRAANCQLILPRSAACSLKRQAVRERADLLAPSFVEARVIEIEHRTPARDGAADPRACLDRHAGPSLDQ